MKLEGAYHTCQSNLIMTINLSDKALLWDAFNNAGLGGKFSLILSTWFFSGLMPLAPGTFGTICAVPLVIAFGYIDMDLRVLFITALIAIAIWSADRSRRLMDLKDPSEIVIDEVAGFALTMSFLPLTAYALMVGFVFFRLFDIFKPFPIKTLERKLQGGIGIVADDLMAGLYALIGAKALLMIFP